MTTTTPTLFDLSRMRLLHLKMSMWTGRARLRAEDIPDDVRQQLPPEELASLGSKKLIDPDYLKPMTQVKTETYTIMSRYGTRFLGGYAIDADKISELEAILRDERDKFSDALRTFLTVYETAVEQWRDQFPAWQAAIDRALPNRVSMLEKFNFRWAVVQVVPDSDESAEALIADVQDQALTDICTELKELQDTSFPVARQSYSKKAFRGFDNLITKANASALFRPEMARLAQLLGDIKNTYVTRTDNLQAMQTVGLVLAGLSQPAILQNMIETYKHTASTGDNLMQALLGTPEPKPAVPDQPQPQPVQPAPAQPVLQNVFANSCLI